MKTLKIPFLVLFCLSILFSSCNKEEGSDFLNKNSVETISADLANILFNSSELEITPELIQIHQNYENYEDFLQNATLGEVDLFESRLGIDNFNKAISDIIISKYGENILKNIPRGELKLMTIEKIKEMKLDAQNNRRKMPCDCLGAALTVYFDAFFLYQDRGYSWEDASTLAYQASMWAEIGCIRGC